VVVPFILLFVDQLQTLGGKDSQARGYDQPEVK
jgi:hypothetical protein